VNSLVAENAVNLKKNRTLQMQGLLSALCAGLSFLAVEYRSVHDIITLLPGTRLLEVLHLCSSSRVGIVNRIGVIMSESILKIIISNNPSSSPLPDKAIANHGSQAAVDLNVIKYSLIAVLRSQGEILCRTFCPSTHGLIDNKIICNSDFQLYQGQGCKIQWLLAGKTIISCPLELGANLPHFPIR
jgi:hypothetical protein